MCPQAQRQQQQAEEEEELRQGPSRKLAQEDGPPPPDYEALRNHPFSAGGCLLGHALRGVAVGLWLQHFSSHSTAATSSTNAQPLFDCRGAE